MPGTAAVLRPFQVSITRLAGASAAVGPPTPVVAQVAEAATPVSTHCASQLARALIVSTPPVSTRPLAVTLPVQSLGL